MTCPNCYMPLRTELLDGQWWHVCLHCGYKEQAKDTEVWQFQKPAKTQPLNKKC